jgi:hypothetical protein
MKRNGSLHLRPPDPDNDFEWAAALLSADVELTSAAEFRQWYFSKPSGEISMQVAETFHGEGLRFQCILDLSNRSLANLLSGFSSVYFWK